MNTLNKQKQQDGKNLISFAKKYGGWHTFAQDKRTYNAVFYAMDYNAIEVNEYGQFMYKE